MANNRRRVKELKKHEFMPYELSKEAFDLYCNSEMAYYTDAEGNFYEAEHNKASDAWLIGDSLAEVEEYFQWALEEFKEEEI